MFDFSFGQIFLKCTTYVLPTIVTFEFHHGISCDSQAFCLHFLKHSKTFPFFFMQKTNLNPLKSLMNNPKILDFPNDGMFMRSQVHPNERIFLLSLLWMFCYFLGKEVDDSSHTHNLHTILLSPS